MRGKRLIAATMIAVVVFGMIGCAKKQEVVKEETTMYSNLVDSKTQKEVQQELIEAGVPEESVTIFMDWVNDYNSNVQEASAFQDGYQEMVTSPVDYSDVLLKEEFKEDGTMLMDMNCRLTAFLLYHDFISVANQTEEYDSYLMFDVEEMDNEDHFKEIRKEREKFIAFFNSIPVEEGSNLEEHIKMIQAAWQERGVSLATKDNIALITMYLHDNLDNTRFVGHVGVALYNQDGVMLIEKYGWNQPFQVTKFADDAAMVKYLLSRPDLVADGTEEPVIVMKNDTVISE